MGESRFARPRSGAREVGFSYNLFTDLSHPVTDQNIIPTLTESTQTLTMAAPPVNKPKKKK